jgi:hypothetical protein
MFCVSFYYRILLQYADGEDFTLSHMNAFDNACEDTLFKNISNYHHDNNGELVLMPNIVTVGWQFINNNKMENMINQTITL